MYIQRKLDLKNLLAKKSFFLFGPRSTGKSSLIDHQLAKQALVIDLLQGDVFLQLSAKPWELAGTIEAHTGEFKYVIIDEIQKIPQLLDEVHHLIEKKSLRFLLTGSSARKLRKSGVNLLAGRAWTAELFPLVMQEIPDFDLNRYLLYGGLPQVYLSLYPNEELKAYINTYLKEEIQVEALVRNLQSFARFLETSALTSGKMINFAELSNDIAVPASTVREFYHILEDTLVGFILPAWSKSVKRKAMSTAKFYFFDVGVRNKIAGIKELPEHSTEYGDAFEHFMAMELRAYLSYTRSEEKLSYWHSYGDYEVDFIIGDTIAIEVKSTNKPSSKHLKGLKALAEENICSKYYLVCMCNTSQIINQIHILNWRDFIEKLWQGKIIC